MSARAALRRVLANAANAPLAMRTAQRGMAGGVHPPASTLVPRIFFALCLICVLIINDPPRLHPDHGHGPPKVNFWEKPTAVSEWKSEQVS